MESLLNCFLCYNYTLIGRRNRKRVSDHQKMRVMSQCLYSYKWSCCKVNQGIRPVLTIDPCWHGLPCAQHRQGDTIIGSGTSSQKIPLGTISQTSSPCPFSPELPHQLMPLSQAHWPHWETLCSSDRTVYHLRALKALPVFFSRTSFPNHTGFCAGAGSLLGLKTFPFVFYLWCLIIFWYNMPKALRTLDCGRWVSSPFLQVETMI